MPRSTLRGPARWGRWNRVLIGLNTLAAASLVACGSGSTPTGSATPGTTASATSTATLTPTPSGTTSASPAPSPPARLTPYLPLFPFAAPSDVVAWQEAYRSAGQQPWHLSSAQTALAFVRWLGYPGIDRVVQTRAARTGVEVSVGHTPAAGEPSGTAAQVHLVRWGTATDAPWEVVGTQDTTLTVTSPAYGSTVGSPSTVGGLIWGVDENIRIQVRTLGGASPVGVSCCLPAGGDGTRWSWRVAFSAPSGAVLTVAVQTGGHLYAVERFAVTGVFAR